MSGTNSYRLFNGTEEDIYFDLYEENNIIGSKLLKAGASVPTYSRNIDTYYTLILFKDEERRVSFGSFCVGGKNIRVYIANGTYMSDDNSGGEGNVMTPSPGFKAKAPSPSQVHNNATLLILVLLVLAFIIFSLRRRG